MALRLSSPAQRASMRRGGRQRVEGKLAQDKTDLAGIDIFAFQIRKGVGVKGRAMRAGHRSIFDNRDRRVAGAKCNIGQSLTRHQLIDRNARDLRQNRNRRLD